jgi:hypothetical protein
MTMATKYTQELYNNLQRAYDYFNEELFQLELPQAVITLNRKTNTLGYYKKNAFTNQEHENISEIALNPDFFNMSIKEILSTLAHEQAHLLCEVRGYVSRRGFHSKQWCQIMKDQCGLQPISVKNGEDVNDGGAKLTHRIIKGDIFDTVCDKLLEEITFDIVNIMEIKEKKEKKTTKVHYVCSENNEHEVVGKPGMQIICGECSIEMKEAE